MSVSRRGLLWSRLKVPEIAEVLSLPTKKSGLRRKT